MLDYSAYQNKTNLNGQLLNSPIAQSEKLTLSFLEHLSKLTRFRHFRFRLILRTRWRFALTHFVNRAINLLSPGDMAVTMPLSLCFKVNTLRLPECNQNCVNICELSHIILTQCYSMQHSMRILQFCRNSRDAEHHPVSPH